MLLASRGARKLGKQEEWIEDAAERRQIRRQALKVILKGVVIGAALTLAAWLLPL